MKRAISVVIRLLIPTCVLGFEPNGIVVFMTDFGVEDDAVAICKGVMLSVDPALHIVDLTHDVTPFDIHEGAVYLAETASEFPPGTVFVGVVDPGVGTERRAIVLESRSDQVFVAPDNGLCTLVALTHGIRGAWEITNPAFMRRDASSTFHGRDLFSPSAALIASGKASPEEAGAPIDSIMRLELPPVRIGNREVHGEVYLLDKAFGNVWTNIARANLEAAFGGMPARLDVTIGSATFSLPVVSTFGEVPAGEPLAYINSRGKLAFAVNMGNFGERYGVQPGNPVAIREE